MVQGLKRGKVQRGLKPKLNKVLDKEDTQDSILDLVEQELGEQGIRLFDNKNVMDNYLVLPADLTEISSQELGRYFNAFTQQKMYCRTLHGRTRAVLREFNEELDSIKDRIYSDLPTKMSVTEKQLKLRGDSRARELLDRVATLEEKKSILTDYLDNLVDAIVCISREITRRESDWNNENRLSNVDRKKR